jgi:ADP-ribose pyrophosphatase YjhB (NUDIX family)
MQKEYEVEVFDGKEFIRATVCVVERDNEFLFIEHHRGKFKDTWNCPGGKMDPEDEDIYHTSMREVREETGIIIPPGLQDIGKLYYENENAKNWVVDFHYTNEFDGELLEPNEECTPFWQDKYDIPADKLIPGDEEIFDRILKEQNFMLYNGLNNKFQNIR